MMRVAVVVAAVVLALPVAAGAQETSLPADVIARVGSTPVSRDDFVHWMNVASVGEGNAQLPPLGSKDFQRLSSQVVQLLLSFQWIDGEAKTEGIAVTDAQVKRSFEQQKRQSFPREADYLKFLAQSGQTEADIMRRVRLDMLSNKIRDRAIKGKDTVTATQISDFYNQHKARFAEPEKRDLRVVLTKDKATAQEAYEALKRGVSWKSVAKRYSIDDTSKNNGGKLPAQAKGTLVKQLDTAVFSAAEGELVGPIKTHYGYYVFTVTGITPARQPTLAQARATIKQTLESQNEQNALDAFVKDFTARWRAITVCGVQYANSDCGSTLPIAGG